MRGSMSDSEAEIVRRLLSAFKYYGFFVVQSELDDISSIYNVLNRSGIAKLVKSVSVGKGFVLISVNRGICGLTCRDKCREAGNECYRLCEEECLKELRVRVVNMLEKHLEKLSRSKA